jgi:orotidine-5'-phosphate decarboxylase
VMLKDGRPMWHHVAGLVDEWGEETVGDNGLSSVGAVVGATHPRAVAEARRLMPRTIFLLPGVGAQGGSVADLARAFQSGPASALVSASRSVIYAYKERGDDFREAAGAEASRLKREVWTASGW